MLHDWRAFTVELLSKGDRGHGPEEDMNKHLYDVCQPLLDALQPWTSPDSRPEVAEQLHRILRDAVKFSQVLRRQRASWSIRNLSATAARRDAAAEGGGGGGDGGRCKFVAGVMRDVDDEGYSSDEQGGFGVRYVSMLIEPGLFKRGNADGENFEIESCMSAALVLCLP